MIYLKETSSKNALRTLVFVTALYIINIKGQGRKLTDPYFKDMYPKSWDDLDRFCVDKPHPVCRLMKFFNKL